MHSCQGELAKINPKFYINQVYDVKTDNGILNVFMHYIPGA